MDNEEVVRAFIEQVINQGNLRAADELLAPTFVDQSPRPGQEPGVQGIKDAIVATKNAFGPITAEIVELLVGEDRVVVRQTISVPLTGATEPFQVEGVDFFRVEGGKILERWGKY